MKYIVRNEQDMHNLAREILSVLSGKSTQSTGATVLALNGDLGAGKTTFTKALASELGITEPITSPTFVIQKSYNIPICNETQCKTLVHIDVYRLNNGGDMQALDWQNTRDNPLNLVIIEWAEIIADTLPDDTIHINFTYIDEATREISVDYSTCNSLNLV